MFNKIKELFKKKHNNKTKELKLVSYEEFMQELYVWGKKHGCEMKLDEKEWYTKVTFEKYGEELLFAFRKEPITIKHKQMYFSQLEKGYKMNIEKETEFKKAAEPLVEYLQTHYHPHCVVVVDQFHAELLEGREVAKYDTVD